MAETLPAGNLLSHETSPYLRQHEDNPVHWRPWGEAALAEAKALDKPILLSVGYAACHWCHVMAHESFESEDVARLMNEKFVNIKVDREERPDIDSIYQSALAMLGEHGGWPLTMFLTPAGEPFWGGTYFPPSARYGRPGFAQVLQQISTIYAEEPEKVRTNAEALRAGLERMSAPADDGDAHTPAMTLARTDEIAHAATQLIDFQWGGTQGAPKFPQPTLFRFLWHAALRSGDERLKTAVTLTLDNLCQGGIYDHLGGGFARYSVDAEWLAPHFEKMLYDNAQLIELLSDVWLRTRTPLYETRVRETVDWMCRELAVTTDHGTVFVSAYDADSEGVEGKFYTWSEQEIARVLGDAGLADTIDEFKQVYGTRPEGNWEGVNILHRDPSDTDDDAVRSERLTRARAALFAVREKRIWPGRDDKVLADWNGMAIAGLARAGMVFDEPDWIAAAEDAFQFVASAMTHDARLLHSWCAGEARHAAVLDDYAAMARGALALHQATGNSTYIDAAAAWARVAREHYRDAATGTYFLAADDTRDLPLRTKVVFDSATPSGNGLMAEVLARLWLLTGDELCRADAEALLTALSPGDPRGLLNQPSVAAGVELMESGMQIVIVGDDDTARALYRAAISVAPPLAVINPVADSSLLNERNPAFGKGLVDGNSAAYLCRGPVCGLPVTDPAALEAALGNTD
ncbi:MAG: thioredoxin domain-containing protein [Rhodospirillales bacterium]